MKRDFDRIRQILLDCEEHAKGNFPLSHDMSAFDKYQIEKMVEAELVTITNATSVGIFVELERYGGSGFVGHSAPTTIKMTWKGHDYLDAVRNAGIWEETKAAVAETGGSATLDILKSLAIGFARKKLSAHTGIEL